MACRERDDLERRNRCQVPPMSIREKDYLKRQVAEFARVLAAALATAGAAKRGGEGA